MKSKRETKIIDNIRHIECLGCHDMLPLSAYRKAKQGRFGRRPRCKKCVSTKKPLEKAVCACDGCETIFEKKVEQHIFCCPNCKSKQNARDYKAKNPDYVKRQNSAAMDWYYNGPKRQNFGEFAILEYRNFDCVRYDDCLYMAAKLDQQIVGCEKCGDYVQNKSIRVSLIRYVKKMVDTDFQICHR